MTKSYKMVVLKYLLEKGPKNWLDPVTPTEVAPYFHQFYMEKNYRKQIDFSNKNTKKLWEYDEEKVAKLIADMPMYKWVGKRSEENTSELQSRFDQVCRILLEKKTN